MRALIIAAVMLSATAPAFAQAQPPCKDRASIVETLANKHNETRVGHGLSTKMQVLEIYASEAGTWTVIVTTAAGIACIVAVGEHWIAAIPELPGEPS